MRVLKVSPGTTTWLATAVHQVQLTFADPAELLYQSGFVLDHKRIIVLQVVDGSQAAEQGLRLGARLTEFMGKVIKNRDDFNEAMHHVKLSDETEPLQLTFLQKQVILTSHVRLHL